jgi:hypothetical protein
MHTPTKEQLEAVTRSSMKKVGPLSRGGPGLNHSDCGVEQDRTGSGSHAFSTWLRNRSMSSFK